MSKRFICTTYVSFTKQANNKPKAVYELTNGYYIYW